MSASHKQLIVVQLNEINFDLVRQYLATEDLPSFRKLLSSYQQFETFAENEYQNLEPWIQWVSAQTGKKFDEHGVFRLGDIVNTDALQIFEVLESSGLKVGAISPMNARNDLRNPAFFIPDPWTDTQCDPSGFSKRLTEMFRQTVNENAKGVISRKSKITIGEAVVRTASVRGTPRLLRLIADSRKESWIKPLVLDQLIHLIHLRKLRGSRPDVSFVFLNAGAHIQHHYLLNSPFSGRDQRNPPWYVPRDADPVLDMLRAYDAMLADYLEMTKHGTRLMVATGLTQVPYNRVKFYYRLKEHSLFLSELGVEHARVLPRMTRDFEVFFANREQAQQAASLLARVTMKRDGLPLFNEIEDRGLSLFVTLTYPQEIHPGDRVAAPDGTEIDVFGKVAFVAIKNGMHSSKGFVFMSPGTVSSVPSQPIHVAGLFDLTLEAAGVSGAH